VLYHGFPKPGLTDTEVVQVRDNVLQCSFK